MLRRGRTLLAVLAGTTGALKGLLTAAVGFVATPLLLRYLGAERLGAYSASQQWFGYLRLLYFGLDTAFVIMLLEAISQANTMKVATLAKAGLRSLAWQSLSVVGPASAIVAWYIPTLVPVGPDISRELRIGAFIGLLSIFVSPFGIFSSVLQTMQLGWLIQVSLLLQSLTTTGLGVLLAWQGYGLPGQFFAALVALTVSQALMTYWTLIRLPGFGTYSAAKIDSVDLRKLRLPLILNGLGTQLSLMTDYIVVGVMLGPIAVTSISITQKWLTLLSVLVGNFSSAIWPGLAELRTAGDTKRFQARVLEAVRLLCGAGTAIVGTVAVYNNRFVHLWVGSGYYGGELLTFLTAGQVLIVNVTSLFSWSIDMQGHARDRMTMNITGAAGNALLSVLFVHWLGIWGVTLGTVVAYLATDAWYSPYVFCYRYGLGRSALIQEVTRSLSWGGIWVVFMWWISRQRTANATWFVFACELGIALIATGLYSAFVVLGSDDRALWRSRFAAAIRSWNRA